MNGLSREKLMRIIQETSFAIDDCKLFLDTHPDDQEALEFYQKCRCLRQEAWEEYTVKYGPLSAYDVNAANIWTWNCGPWPWQVEG